MRTAVEFFYGLGSRYSYLASTQIEALERDTGCRVVWRPLSSVDLMALRGRSPFAGEPISGQYDWDYRRRDAEAWADYYGVPYVEPAPFVMDPRAFAAACHAAGRLGAVEAYSRRMFASIFVDHATVDRDLCIRLAGDCGIGSGVFARLIDDASVTEEVKTTTAEAHRRGAFGVPTFFVDERMIWGNDRLPLLKHHLAGRQPSA